MLRQAARLLEGANTVTIILHQQPDGDAIGSGSALAEALRSQGKAVNIFCASQIAPVFLEVVGELNCQELLSASGVIVILDCGDLHRTGCARQLEKFAKSGGQLIAIDHHQGSDWSAITRYACVRRTASSTAELVFELINHLGAALSPKIATALLLGVYSDTGGFTHPNTTDAALRLAGRLGYYGADLRRINRAFERHQPTPKARLWGAVMSELTLNRWGIVVAFVRPEQFDQTQTTLEDIAGLANAIALVEEARAALVMIESADGYRGILRTRHDQINVSRLARLLGGAGRPQAAGFTATKELFPGKLS